MIHPITPEAAMLAGYQSITAPYSEHEQGMLKSALLTMTGCNVALVAVAYGTEIWRKKSEIRTDESGELSAADVKRKGGRK